MLLESLDRRANLATYGEKDTIMTTLELLLFEHIDPVAQRLVNYN
jgi:hypothetical protein